jgi:PAS domain S-box-containing protein
MGQLGAVMGLRADGEEFPVEAAISHITVEGQKFYTVILRDITERRQAEQLFRRNEERYRQLIAASPLAIVVYRADKVTLINDAGLKLFDAATQSEMLGKSHFDLFHQDSHALIRERIQQLLEGSTTVPVVEEKILTLDGRIVEVEVNKAKFIDEEGPAILSMIRDISERKRLQEQLRKTERIAELGTLASGMAHEIGTPMNVILGRAEYLMQRTQEEPLKKGLQTIITQVERITKVMNQLLAFARRRPPEGRAIDLVQTIEDSLEIFQERMLQSRITVEKVIDANVPLVRADRDELIQVQINLVTNSLHAMPTGGRLRLSLAHENSHVCLGVSDTGHGMPEDIRSKIFEPFFTTKDFGKGTGLGLTVVKGIIEECGGTIAVESAVDKGTTFWIRLPLDKVQTTVTT